MGGGSARIHAVDGEGRPVHLAIFMRMLMEGANPRKARSERVAELKHFVVSICLAIGVLWEGTRDDPSVWERVGALQVGNLKATAAKRRHRISRTFKRQLSFAARNAIGLGVQNPRQVLVGMAAVTRKGPTKQLTMKERKAQGKSDVCPTAKCEELQCWNYFLDSRTEPLSCCGAQPRSKDAKFSPHKLCPKKSFQSSKGFLFPRHPHPQDYPPIPSPWTHLPGRVIPQIGPWH